MDYNALMKGLSIGSSVGHNISKEKFEKATNSKITYVKTYAAEYDKIVMIGLEFKQGVLKYTTLI